jgi:hypothetical protein
MMKSMTVLVAPMPAKMSLSACFLVIFSVTTMNFLD